VASGLGSSGASQVEAGNDLLELQGQSAANGGGPGFGAASSVGKAFSGNAFGVTQTSGFAFGNGLGIGKGLVSSGNGLTVAQAEGIANSAENGLAHGTGSCFC
jgi:hypothetical protein